VAVLATSCHPSLWMMQRFERYCQVKLRLDSGSVM
jgi:hypothetical protein